MDSKAVISFCHIYRCLRAGVASGDKDQSVKINVEHCLITNSGTLGGIFTNGELVAFNCLINKNTSINKPGGITARMTVVTGCEIADNDGSGIVILEKGKFKVTDCLIRNNRKFGVVMGENATAEFYNNTFRENGQGHWSIDDTATVIRRGNRPSDE